MTHLSIKESLFKKAGFFTVAVIVSTFLSGQSFAQTQNPTQPATTPTQTSPTSPSQNQNPNYTTPQNQNPNYNTPQQTKPVQVTPDTSHRRSTIKTVDSTHTSTTHTTMSKEDRMKVVGSDKMTGKDSQGRELYRDANGRSYYVDDNGKKIYVPK